MTPIGNCILVVIVFDICRKNIGKYFQMKMFHFTNIKILCIETLGNLVFDLKIFNGTFQYLGAITHNLMGIHQVEHLSYFV